MFISTQVSALHVSDSKGPSSGASLYVLHVQTMVRADTSSWYNFLGRTGLVGMYIYCKNDTRTFQCQVLDAAFTADIYTASYRLLSFCPSLHLVLKETEDA